MSHWKMNFCAQAAARGEAGRSSGGNLAAGDGHGWFLHNLPSGSYSSNVNLRWKNSKLGGGR